MKKAIYSFIILGLLVLLPLVRPSSASLGTVADLFRQGRYEEARQALQAGGEGSRPGEDLFWGSRLATRVDDALEILESARTVPDLPPALQQGLALELAEIQFARGRYRECLNTLEPLISSGEENLPGEIYLLAGLAYRLGGRLQTAREMLASVRPGDPAFVQARFHLGEIGLQQGDSSLALRYYQSGIRDEDRGPYPGLEAGQWRALREAGKTGEADQILARLRHDAPGSLALLEINRILREEGEELAARAGGVQAAPDSTATQPVNRNGRYSLQLGAFSDRSLALEFLRRYREQVQDLRVDQVRDSHGQFLYKIRSGSYVNPALARSEAARYRHSLGIDVIVADLGRDNH